MIMAFADNYMYSDFNLILINLCDHLPELNKWFLFVE